MKKTLLIIFLFFGFLESQATKSLNPGIHFVYMQQCKLFGYKISNDFKFQTKIGSFELGFDFVLAKGNVGVDLDAYDLYNFEYGNHNLYYPFVIGGPAAYYNYPIELKVKTSSSYNLATKFAYNLSKTIKGKELGFKIGPYFSYISTTYLIGTYENTPVTFYASKILYATQYLDVTFPVYLNYFNLGFYTSLSYELFKIKGFPVKACVEYYYGKNKTGLFSIGIATTFNTKEKVN